MGVEGPAFKAALRASSLIQTNDCQSEVSKPRSNQGQHMTGFSTKGKVVCMTLSPFQLLRLDDPEVYFLVP